MSLLQSEAPEDSKNRLGIVRVILVVGIIAAAVRVALIYHERNREPEPPPAVAVDPVKEQQIADDVFLPRVYAYDLASSRELVGKTLWVRAGNQMTYYPYGPAARRAAFEREAGVLKPLEELTVKHVFAQRPPTGGDTQLMMAFTKQGSPQQFAVAFGAQRGDNANIFVNEAFFLKDPHLAFKHWPADVWQAIDSHQVKAGMSELQVALSIGAGASDGSGDYGNRTLEYDNSGDPMTIRYEAGRAVSITRPKK
jgi:hypothetical protein